MDWKDVNVEAYLEGVSHRLLQLYAVSGTNVKHILMEDSPKRKVTMIWKRYKVI